jgi:8-oxo-dGTP diphosphatase
MIFLVRHAKAGDRLHDIHEDRKRPLSKPGWAQAEALAGSLIDAGAMGPLISSPFVRCRQTLEPLARRLDLEIIRNDDLSESKPFEPMLRLLQSTPDGSVLCSHGDMIPDMIAGLERRGCLITTAPHWKKGSVWLLERAPDGSFVSAESWPPPL